MMRRRKYSAMPSLTVAVEEKECSNSALELRNGWGMGGMARRLLGNCCRWSSPDDQFGGFFLEI